MGTGRSGESEAAVRALRGANEEIEALRAGGLEPEDARGYILRVANAVDRSLRRYLRDDEAADLSLRLKALAPDELRSDAVLAELRRNERLPMELAAGVHELLDVRRRLERGSLPTDGDRLRAVQVADLLGRVYEEPAVSEFSALPPPSGAGQVVDEPIAEVQPVAARRRRRAAAVPAWPFAAVVLVLLIVLGVLRFGTGRSPGMEEGIALFRSGAYTEAAHHFWRYAEANPRDPTPHLYLARIHRRTENFDLAADALRQAMDLAPEDPAVHREQGFLLLDRERPDLAVDRFRHAIELEESSSEAWVGLVRALREAGRGGEVDRVLANAPAEVRALLDRSPAN
jgi:tetratricopeptide (TPR) repeat protein